MFDDLWNFGWPFSGFGYGMGGHPRQSHHQQQQDREWTASLNLSGFRQNDVKIDRAKDNSFVKVHAKNEQGDDLAEIRRTIQIPDTVDREQVDVDFSRDGILMVRAPYKKRQSQQLDYGGNQWALQPFTGPEFRDLNNDMWTLATQSFPGTMQSNIVRGEDGSAKLQMDFNLSGYKPEEISVNQEGNILTVEAKHESKTKEGSSFKHFKRMFTIPKNVNGEQLKSRLLGDGRLRLEAPCNIKYPEQQAIQDREIPVSRGAKGRQ